MFNIRFPRSVRRLRTHLQNKRRRDREISPYIALTFNGEMVEFPTPLPLPDIPFIDRIVDWLPISDGPESVHSWRYTFERLAADPRIKGVCLKINCHADVAVYQSLHQMIVEFRATGKRVVAYAESFGPFQYYLACACDQIIMPPTAEWSVLGFLNEYVFFKDALEKVGVGVDLVRVSPFKSAGDQFVQTDFSADSRAQAEWLLDARFDELVRGIATGRKLSETHVRYLINKAPFSAAEAVNKGLLDAVLYEDELPHYMDPAWVQRKPDPPPRWFMSLPAHWQKKLEDQVQNQPPPVLSTWSQLNDDLLIPWHEYTEKAVGIIRIEGALTRGNSVDNPLPIPFFEGGTAGSNTITQMIRRAETEKKVVAVVLFVNSPGGDALASDLIARELRRLQQKKPVVVYMGGTAASGGYYVAAHANHIVAQPMTITGSIGVFALKPHTQQAYGKLHLHRTLLQRGEHASMFSDATPLNQSERVALENSVQRTYADFKKVVADGRGLDYESLEPICGGRVWTGAMAQAHKLVDELGDFRCALNKARELARLPADGDREHAGAKRLRLQFIYPPREYKLPRPFLAQTLVGLMEPLPQLLALIKQSRMWMMATLAPASQKTD